MTVKALTERRILTQLQEERREMVALIERTQREIRKHDKVIAAYKLELMSR